MSREALVVDTVFFYVFLIHLSGLAEGFISSTCQIDSIVYVNSLIHCSRCEFRQICHLRRHYMLRGNSR